LFGFGRRAFGLPPPALDVEGVGAEAGNPRRAEVNRSEESATSTKGRPILPRSRIGRAPRPLQEPGPPPSLVSS